MVKDFPPLVPILLQLVFQTINVVQNRFGQCSQTYGLIFVCSCVEPAAPCGFLPTWAIQWLYDGMLYVTTSQSGMAPGVL